MKSRFWNVLAWALLVFGVVFALIPVAAQAQTRYPAYPANSAFAYVSDSKSALFPATSPTAPARHYHGVLNQRQTYPANTTVEIYVHYAGVNVAPQSPNVATDTVQQMVNDLLNVDVLFEVYCVATCPVGPTGVRAAFVNPYGTAANGQFLNASGNFYHGARSVPRQFRDLPLILTVTTPSTPGQYQIGLTVDLFSKHATPYHAHYDVAVHAAFVVVP